MIVKSYVVAQTTLDLNVKRKNKQNVCIHYICLYIRIYRAKLSIYTSMQTDIEKYVSIFVKYERFSIATIQKPAPANDCIEN